MKHARRLGGLVMIGMTLLGASNVLSQEAGPTVPAELHEPWAGHVPELNEADYLALIQVLTDLNDPDLNPLIAACYHALAELHRRAGDPAAGQRDLAAAAEWNPLLQHEALAATIARGENLPQTIITLNTLIAQVESGRVDLRKVAGTTFLQQVVLRTAGDLDRKIAYYDPRQDAPQWLFFLRRYYEKGAAPDRETLLNEMGGCANRHLAFRAMRAWRTRPEAEKSLTSEEDSTTPPYFAATRDRREQLEEDPTLGMQWDLIQLYPDPDSCTVLVIRAGVLCRKLAELYDWRAALAPTEEAAAADREAAAQARAWVAITEETVDRLHAITGELELADRLPLSFAMLEERYAEQVLGLETVDPDYIQHLAEQLGKTYRADRESERRQIQHLLDILESDEWHMGHLVGLAILLERYQDVVLALLGRGEWQAAQTQQAYLTELAEQWVEKTTLEKAGKSSQIIEGYRKRFERLREPVVSEARLSFNPYFLRGLALLKLEQFPQAEADFDRARAYNRTVHRQVFGPQGADPADEAAPLITFTLAVTEAKIAHNLVLARQGQE